MLQVRETWFNDSKGYELGDSGWQEPFTEERGRLFRALQREHGRCTSRLYREAPRTAATAGFGAVGSAPVGWYFQVTRRYQDTGASYVAGTAVELRTVPDGC